MGVRLLKSSISFSSHITWPTKLKLWVGRIILVISAHSHSVPDFEISSQGEPWGARLSKSSNRFTAYSSYPIELKLGRMILDISSHNRSEPEFSIHFQRAL